MDAKKKAFLDCIGKVNVGFSDHDPALVGATCLPSNDEYEFGVRFLVSTESDLARAVSQDLLAELRHEMEEEVARGCVASGEKLHVELSSLEAQGIRLSEGSYIRRQERSRQ